MFFLYLLRNLLCLIYFGIAVFEAWLWEWEVLDRYICVNIQQKKLLLPQDTTSFNLAYITQEPEVRIPITQGIVGHVATTGKKLGTTMHWCIAPKNKKRKM